MIAEKYADSEIIPSSVYGDEGIHRSGQDSDKRLQLLKSRFYPDIK